MPAEPSADTLAGQLIGGRYRLIRRIGKGGMGVVYEAEHVGLDKRVAVKFLLDRFADDPEVIERFHREARLASRIGQDNIIDVHDVGTGDDGRPYIVMELLDGADLGKVLSASGPMPAGRAVHVIRQILVGLGAAHGKGIVHRDMKPENVFLVSRGDDPDFVKIMDFGISKIIAANESKVRLTATGAVIGTPIYMAPEQALAHAELDHRVDLYAVGVMLFELLAGRPPFMAQNYLGLVTQHLNTPPPNLATIRRDLPASLVTAVARALEKDPARRWGTAADFARALPPESQLRALDAAATLGDTMDVRPLTDGVRAVGAGASQGLTPAPERVRRRRTAAWIVGSAVALSVGMIVVVAATRGDRDAPPPEPVPAAIADEDRVEPAPPPEVVSLGKIDVRVQPHGARVFVDGVLKGTSPILLSGVPAGAHDLRLEKEGHQTVALGIVVGGGAPYVVDDVLPALGDSTATDKTPDKTTDKTTDKKERPKIRSTGSGSGSGTGAGTGTGTGSGTGAGSGSGSSGKKPGRPGQKPNPYD